MYKSQTSEQVNQPPFSAGSQNIEACYSNENQPLSQEQSALNQSNYGGFKAGTSSYATKNAMMAEVFNSNNANNSLNLKSSYAKNEFVKRENELIGAWESDMHPLKVHRVINIST